MSDSKKTPKAPPPDDFSKTTPNIPTDDDSDWSAGRSDVPSETPADDWGKTVINYNVSEEHEETGSFGEQQHPSGSPKQPDWGMTQANVNVDDDFGSGDSGSDEAYGATTPYFKLPEADRKQYQNIPPTPAETAAKEESEKKGGIPLWFWAAAGIMTLLTFSFFLFLGVWYFILADNGFELTIEGPESGSTFTVDGAPWGIEVAGKDTDTYLLSGLKSGEREIKVVNPKLECSKNPFTIEGKEGDKLRKVVTCTQKSTLDCENTRNIQERARCAEMALDALGNPPDLDALLKALNMLIINFASGSAEVPSDKKAILRKAAEKIGQLPESVQIEVGGHTDNVGGDESNQKLSEARAASVKKVLVDFGVREATLTTKGYGKSQPKADNNTSQGRFDNRRIQYSAVKR